MKLTLPILLSLAACAHAQNNWLGNTAGLESDWGTATNWSLGTVPATNLDIAAFLATGSATVNLAAPQTVQVIGFDATAQPYTFTGAALTIDNNQSISSEALVATAGMGAVNFQNPLIFTNSNTSGGGYVRLGSGASVRMSGGVTVIKDVQVNDNPANAASPGGTLRIQGGNLDLQATLLVREHATVTLNPATVSGTGQIRDTDNNSRINIENSLPGYGGSLLIGTSGSTTHNGKIFLTAEGISISSSLLWNAVGASGTNTADQTYGVDIPGAGKVATHSGAMTFGNLTASGATGTTATYKIDTSDDILFVTGAIGGTATGYTTPKLQKQGAGIAVFSGANTYPFVTEVRAGTLLVNNTSGSGLGGGTFDIFNTALGGGGTGTITGNLNVRALSIFTPGGDPALPGFGLGTFTAGSVNFTGTGTNGSTINFQIKSPAELDRVVTAGAMNIQAAVKLLVTTVAGFSPAPGQSYDLLDWGTRTGTGDLAPLLTLPALGPGILWDKTTFNTNGAVNIVFDNTVTSRTWDGGGANNTWIADANWSIDVRPLNNATADVIFAGTTRLAPSVDTAWNVRSITFDNTAGAFTITGPQAITVGTGGIVNNDADLQTITAALTLAGSETFTAAAGALTVNSVNIGTNTLTIAGTAATHLGSTTGAGTITKIDAGTLTITGTLGAGETLNANGSNTIFKVSETLAALNIGPGGKVTLDPLAMSPAPAGEFAAVPEPASLALLALGALTLVRTRRK